MQLNSNHAQNFSDNNVQIHKTSFNTSDDITVTYTSHSEGDWYLVHRLYYSCNLLVCNKGLWEYADDDDWSSVVITLRLNSGNYVSLEHEASNLNHYPVTANFDSYWTHAHESDVLDTGSKSTLQYWTMGEREIQSGLLTTRNAQTTDKVYSTMRAH